MNLKTIKKNICDEKYLKIFFIGFAMFFAAVLPIMIFTGGYFLYYGDYNSQQIPFYIHAHDFIKSEGLGWDWGTDLGSNFVGSYSFYLLGSPFFWLTLPLPNSLVVFAMPVLLAVKHGVAVLTSYAFIKRFVRSKNAALIGAVLYAFSGFQLFNIFFNHFHDVTALFPLMLIALEEYVNNNRRGYFAITVAVMGMVNYFFFTGQAVFVIIYILARLGSPDFRMTWKKFFGVALEAVIGVMTAMVILLPAALGILGNYRINERLYGLDLVTYSDKTRILRIIQSFFMIPDVPARPNLFSSDNAKWASIGGYLPMFSMAGVIAFAKSRKKHWSVKLVAVCIVCAFIPVLNSMFYTFNSSYYARWYYMPILIMAMMTAHALDDVRVDFKPAIRICFGVMAAMAVIAILPKKVDDEVKWFEFANYPAYFALVLGVSIVGLILLYRVDKLRRNGYDFMKSAFISTLACTFASTVCVVYFGVSLGSYPDTYIGNGIKGSENLQLDNPDDAFYRLDISENYDNYPMMWEQSSMRAFQSTVPASIMEFYSEIGITRDVASRAPIENYTLRGLFSVKYYLERVDENTKEEYTYMTELPGFSYKDIQNGFYVYENDYYIPMGFAYDYYTPLEDTTKHTDTTIERSMLRSLVISEEDAKNNADIVTELPYDMMAVLGQEDYIRDCMDRQAEACSEFEYDSEGFDAKIALDKSKLVFFSVPYEDGWKAYVNGKPADIIRANYGFMAVRAEQGENTITFEYETPGLKIGFICTLAGITILIGYLFVMRNKKGNNPVCSHYYDYDKVFSCEAEENYIQSILESIDMD